MLISGLDHEYFTAGIKTCFGLCQNRYETMYPIFVNFGYGGYGIIRWKATTEARSH